MKLEIDINHLVDSMLDSVEGEDVKRQIENYWSIILLDNLPQLETEVRKELEKRGFNL